MCPEVEKRLKERKRKRVFVITRRDFLKAVGSSLLFFPFIPQSISFSVELSLPFNWGCVKCSWGFCMCGGLIPRPSIYNKFWYPVGFIEINRQCEFMTSVLPLAGELIGGALANLCSFLPNFWIQGADMSQNVGIGKLNQQYMRVHARWYGLTPDIESVIVTYLTAVELCPCPSIDVVKNIATGGLYNRIAELEEKLEQIREQIDRIREVIDKIGSLPLPVFFTEILSPIWLVETLSPDNILTQNIRQAIMHAVLNFGGTVGHAVFCLAVKKALEQLGFDLSFGGLVDPNFFCVGLWGYGYPRIGVVRNDDPVIAHLLASARFHHLFSRTIPVIPFELDMKNIRYQLVRPFSSECMEIGCGGFTIPNACDLVRGLSNPSEIINVVKDRITSVAGRSMNALDRKMMLVVWKKKKKCCC